MDNTYRITIQGIRPLLMHNGRLADPMDPAAKKLKEASKLRNKSDEDHIAVARVEFEGGLYHDEELGPYLPCDNLTACMIEGARRRKLGKQFESGAEVVVPDTGAEGYKLEYKGPRTVEALWLDPNNSLRKKAKVGQASVPRTRPRFATGWKCSFLVEVLDGAVTDEQVKTALSDAGLFIGIGDWTPRYGRFTLAEFKQV